MKITYIRELQTPLFPNSYVNPVSVNPSEKQANKNKAQST